LCLVVVDLLLKSSDKVVLVVVVKWRVSCAHTNTLPRSLPPSLSHRQTDRFWKIICEEELLIPKLVSSPLLFLVSQRQLIELGFLSQLRCFGFLQIHTQFALHPPTRPHTHTHSYSFDSVLENHREKDRQTEKGMGIPGVLDSGQKRLQELGYKQELQRDLSYVGGPFPNTPSTKLDLLLLISKSQQPLQLQS
jgi:hypothetical protein